MLRRILLLGLTQTQRFTSLLNVGTGRGRCGKQQCWPILAIWAYVILPLLRLKTTSAAMACLPFLSQWDCANSRSTWHLALTKFSIFSGACSAFVGRWQLSSAKTTTFKKHPELDLLNAYRWQMLFGSVFQCLILLQANSRASYSMGHLILLRCDL